MERIEGFKAFCEERIVPARGEIVSAYTACRAYRNYLDYDQDSKKYPSLNGKQFLSLMEIFYYTARMKSKKEVPYYRDIKILKNGIEVEDYNNYIIEHKN